MARILGVNIPDNKHIVISLTYIYGIGLTRSKEICRDLAFDEARKVSDLSEEDLDKLRNQMKKYILEGDLKRSVYTCIKRLVDIGCYRGSRHKTGLPVRGQRTKNNAKTRKKNRKFAR